jgi:pimeloyl-ACP methyl ester carboxylesterase
VRERSPSRHCNGCRRRRSQQADEDLIDGLEPVLGTPERARQFERFLLSLNAGDLLDAEPGLAKLDVPTLVVWGTDDDLFALSWACWLKETIPGVTEVIEIDGARLFFPDERAANWHRSCAGTGTQVPLARERSAAGRARGDPGGH